MKKATITFESDGEKVETNIDNSEIPFTVIYTLLKKLVDIMSHKIAGDAIDMGFESEEFIEEMIAARFNFEHVKFKDAN